MWKEDPELLHAAIETMTSSVEQLSTADVSVLFEALDAAGTLALLGHGKRALELVARADARQLQRAVNDALGGMDLDELDQAVVTLLTRTGDLDTCDEADRLEVLEAVREVLSTRDRLDRVLRGAQLILGRPAPLNVDQRGCLEHFDTVVRSELWRTVPLNDSRSAAIAWVEPRQRKALWWWAHGADVPTDALDSLADAALLIQRFPEARAELERLIEGEQLVQRATRSNVIDLASWVARRRSALRRQEAAFDQDEPLRAAAADSRDEEIPLYEDRNLDVSFVFPDRLFLDVKADRKEGVPPRVSAGARDLEVTPVPKTVERFVAALDDRALAEPKLFISLGLVNGAVQVVLPGEGDV